MRKIDLIVVHCADTPATMDIGAAEIREWHTMPPPKGRGWDDIGYHFVIRRDGAVDVGRALDTPGAHVAGHNANSIGICLVGGKGGPNFTKPQMTQLRALIALLLVSFPKSQLLGHRDLDPHKECPTFDVRAWWAESK